MKYIKKIEAVDTDMIPGMMYKTDVYGMQQRILGFVGINRSEKFFLTCIDFTGKEPCIVEYRKVGVMPLNKSIKDYIIKRDEFVDEDYVNKILNLLKEIDYGTKTSEKLCKKLYDELSEDDDIQSYLQSKKYNL